MLLLCLLLCVHALVSSDGQTSMRIVPFEARHADAWRDLNAAWISKHFTLETKDIEALSDPRGAILDKGGHIFMAEDDARDAVGCVGLLPMSDGGLEVVKMTVKEEVRGQGVGRLLMQACIDKGAALGVPRLYLESNSSLAPALALYRATGFVDLPPCATPYVRCDVWMERRY
jgi:putative acetyltransferase